MQTMKKTNQVVDVREQNEWDKVTNKPIKRIGTIYRVLRYKLSGPVMVNVKVPDLNEAITAQEIRDNHKNHIIVWASFEDYEEEAYVRNGVVYYTATASSVTIDLEGPGLFPDDLNLNS